MRDVELYKTILGLTPPWAVVDVTLDVKGQHVTVRVHAGDGPFPCPECHTPAPGYDKKPRRWRHLDTCQFTTWIEAEVPRVACPTHGVRQLPVPWAAPAHQRRPGGRQRHDPVGEEDGTGLPERRVL